jgi:hypothetical protein
MSLLRESGIDCNEQRVVRLNNIYQALYSIKPLYYLIKISNSLNQTAI